MSAGAFVRRSHRWVSIAFTVAVVVNMAWWIRKEPPAWVGLLAFVPLVTLLVSGLYLFVLPYFKKRGTNQQRA